MTAKKDVQSFKDLTKSRNHTLVNVTNPDTPAQGNLVIACNTCNTTFTTSAKSYQNARKTGCPNCKAINAKDQSNYNKAQKPTPSVTSAVDPLVNQQALKRAQEKTSNKIVKRATLQRSGNLYSRSALIAQLQEEDSAYNRHMLALMLKKRSSFAC